jgi:Terminase large subunit, T4likevirus-type, N-terminal
VSTIALERRLAHAEAMVDRQTAVVPRWSTPIDLADRVGIDLDAWQRRVAASTAKRVILKGPRQIGKSTVSGLLSLHVALTVPESLTLLIAPSQDQSKESARTVRRMAAAVGLSTTERVEAITPTLLSASRIEFGNGARIIALPGRSEATIRGYGAPDLIVCDEASRISEDTYAAIRPMLVASPNGRMVLISTPWLKFGTFYRTWTDDAPGWERIDVASAECPRLTPGYLDQERRELPVWVFNREYLGLFSDDDTTLFPAELVAAAMDATIRPLFPDGPTGSRQEPSA